MKKQQLKRYGWSITIAIVGLLAIAFPSIADFLGYPLPESDAVLSTAAVCKSLGALIVLVSMVMAWIVWDRGRIPHEEVVVKFK